MDAGKCLEKIGFKGSLSETGVMVYSKPVLWSSHLAFIAPACGMHLEGLQSGARCCICTADMTPVREYLCNSVLEAIRIVTSLTSEEKLRSCS